jgi:stage II sporulation protein D
MTRRLRGVATLLTGLGVLAAGAGCTTTAPAPGAFPAVTNERPSLVLPRTLRVRTAGRVVTVALEDYVLGSALSEVSPVAEPPATTARIFEVQAILARTYAVAHLGRHAEDDFDLCDGTHCQLYQPARLTTSRFAAVAREAVRQTAGEVLVYRGAPAETLFHADCGGHTDSASAVWGGAPVPYLTGRIDDVPEGTHRTWHADARSRVGGRLTGLRVSARDDSGRAAFVEIQGARTVTVRGEIFRSIVTDALGVRSLQSTRFVVRRAGGAFHFEGVGFGHGVGLCQVGAAARARRGETVEEILAAYYPGTTLVQAR